MLHWQRLPSSVGTIAFLVRSVGVAGLVTAVISAMVVAAISEETALRTEDTSERTDSTGVALALTVTLTVVLMVLVKKVVGEAAVSEVALPRRDETWLKMDESGGVAVISTEGVGWMLMIVGKNPVDAVGSTLTIEGNASVKTESVLEEMVVVEMESDMETIGVLLKV
jgi:hypothetical protein